MRRWAPGLLVLAAAALLVAQEPPPASSPRLDAAMQAFWAAGDAAARSAAAAGVLAAGAGFDEIAARLRAGRTYTARPAGRVALPTHIRGVLHDNALEVPEGYDPSRAWPLRVTLHGAVGRAAPQPDDFPVPPLRSRLASDREFVLHPRGWQGSQWWTAVQVQNLEQLLDRVKRDYNVDESRVYVSGVSDGGTGVYFLGMRAATPWAIGVPLIGHVLVLANPKVGADGQLYPANLANLPLYVFNGARDRLYPETEVRAVMDLLRNARVTFQFRLQQGAGHDVRWWPDERHVVERFLAQHPRQPHPPRVTWETERTDRYNRFRWVVIDELGPRSSDRGLGDVNAIETTNGPVTIFSRTQPSGRVDAVREGNAYDVRTRGVRAFTLLLSPDVVDFARPVRIVVNGRVVHDAAVEKSVATLLEWFARDHDRTMLYGAAVRVLVP